jgi:hypothetical protein
MPIGGTGAHEGERGRLAAVVGHQVQRLALDPVRELAVHGAVERDQPMPGPRLQAGGQVDLPRLGRGFLGSVLRLARSFGLASPADR